MSRRKKNLRAFLHQNPNPTIEQAWDSAWEGAQKRYHAKRIAELEAKLERMEQAAKQACDALRDEQYAQQPVLPWPTLAPIFNKLYAALEEQDNGSN